MQFDDTDINVADLLFSRLPLDEDGTLVGSADKPGGISAIAGCKETDAARTEVVSRGQRKHLRNHAFERGLIDAEHFHEGVQDSYRIVLRIADRLRRNRERILDHVAAFYS